jgi:predicted RNA-binding protein YlqC (UPF0109 family)
VIHSGIPYQSYSSTLSVSDIDAERIIKKENIAIKEIRKTLQSCENDISRRRVLDYLYSIYFNK